MNYQVLFIEYNWYLQRELFSHCKIYQEFYFHNEKNNKLLGLYLMNYMQCLRIERIKENAINRKKPLFSILKHAREIKKKKPHS